MSFDNARTKVLNKASLHLNEYVLLDVHLRAAGPYEKNSLYTSKNFFYPLRRFIMRNISEKFQLVSRKIDRAQAL